MFGDIDGQYSALMDQMGSLPVGDPRVMDLYLQSVRIWADEEPGIPLVQTPSLLLFNSTYWTGWPTANNNYVQPTCWVCCCCMRWRSPLGSFP